MHINFTEGDIYAVSQLPTKENSKRLYKQIYDETALKLLQKSQRVVSLNGEYFAIHHKFFTYYM